MPRPKGGKYRIDDTGAGSYFVSLEDVPTDHMTLMIKRIIESGLRSAGFGLRYDRSFIARARLFLAAGDVSPRRFGRKGAYHDLPTFARCLQNAPQQQLGQAARFE